jgi:hypothetical protein
MFFSKRIMVFVCLNTTGLVGFSQKVDKLNACWWATHPIDFALLQSNARSILTKSKDGCVIALLDKLVDSSGKKDGQRYVKTLGDIRKVSDGYVSDYFDEVGSKLFYNSFSNLFSELYGRGGKVNDYLEKIVVESLGVRIADAENKNNEKKKLEAFIAQKKSLLKLSVNEKKYLDVLKQKIYAFSEQ